jgi:hypothetical protein
MLFKNSSDDLISFRKNIISIVLHKISSMYVNISHYRHNTALEILLNPRGYRGNLPSSRLENIDDFYGSYTFTISGAIWRPKPNLILGLQK